MASSKVAIVTGANKGIGFAIVRGLCQRFDGTVYLTSRDIDRGQQAVAELEKEGLKPKYHQLDITDTFSVEAFRNYLKENHEGIDILVNNAAIAYKVSSPEPVDIQAGQTLLVNFFSLVTTCDVLFPLLKKGARVINMSSSAGHLSSIPSQNLKDCLKNETLSLQELINMMTHYLSEAKKDTHVTDWGNSSYAVSKVAVTALTHIQQRMLEHRDIKVNSVHPGYVNTDMTSHQGTMTIDQGAEAPLYLALDAPDSIKGKYVWFDKTIVDWTGEKPVEVY